MDRNVLGFNERDVLDQPRDLAFALDGGGAWIVPDAWEVRCEGKNTRARLLGKQPLIGLALTVLLLLGCIEPTKMLIPVGFERIGHQAIVRINLQIAATRKLTLEGLGNQLIQGLPVHGQRTDQI